MAAISIGRSVRALLIAALALGAAMLTWRLRPGVPATTTTPDGDIVAMCRWGSWLAANYLCVAVAAAAIGQLRASTRVVARLAPPAIRRLIETTVSVGVVACLATPSVAAAAPARPVVVSSPMHPTGAPLDWPGLGLVSQPPTPAPSRSPATADVVVRPGDTLWSIAAARLGPAASPDQVAASWPRWYAANRDVIGADPSVIHPGERLVAPPSETPPPDQPRSQQ